MSMELKELYQEVIMDHNRHPRHFYEMLEATVSTNGYNPLCGDRLTIYLKMDEDIIADISFLGSGCAISQASASLMTDVLCGKTLAQAHVLFHKMHQLLTGHMQAIDQQTLGKLSVLSGVCAYPARVKCATLAWHTLESAMQKVMTQEPI